MALEWRTLGSGAPPQPLGGDEIQLHLVPREDAHAWRDALLAAALAQPASTLKHARGAHGRPYLEASDAPHYNLSHTRDAALVAIAHGAAVGVDLEAPRAVARREALLARFFVAHERDAIAASDDPGRLLLHAWAGKEAMVKAIGRGIAYGLARVELAFAHERVAGLAALDGPASDAGPWSVCSFEVPGGRLGAVAWHGGTRRLRAFRRG